MQSSTSHSSLRPFGWCVALLLISTQSWGQETGCISGNCVNGQGTYVFTNGMKYVGEWKDGKQHGQVTYTSVDGSVKHLTAIKTEAKANKEKNFNRIGDIMGEFLHNYYDWAYDFLQLLGGYTYLGYMLVNFLIFIFIQPGLIILFFVLWRKERNKNLRGQ